MTFSLPSYSPDLFAAVPCAALGREPLGEPHKPGQEPKHRGRRLLALAAAIAVPAMAAPADWHGFGSSADAVGKTALAQPMPFERPGGSFPGSAFYYVAENAGLAYDFGLSPAGELGQASPVLKDPFAAPTNAELVAIGPAARAFRGRGDGVDRARALQCMTMAVHYEAASESIAGRRGVAQVVLNRVAHPSYPNSVCGVVFQGSERRTGCQFSFTCDGSLARRPGGASWRRAQGVALRALGGEVFAGVGLATHYHTTAIYPYWAPSLSHIGTIGAHRFYRWKGAAGTPLAFRATYSGREPMASPHPRSVSSPDSIADPVTLARAYEAAHPELVQAVAARPGALSAAVPAARATPLPDYSAQVRRNGGDAQFTAQNLPDSGGIKQEYAGSGRWLRDPADGPGPGPAKAPARR